MSEASPTVSFIRWRDASHAMSEHSLADMEPVNLEEIGFLIKETEEAVTIAIERAIENSTRLWICIPKVNIIERRDMPLDKAFPARRRRK